MADLKISQLTSATLPLAGTEVLPIVQSSSTKKVATDDLTVKNVRSNATTGILQIAGPAAAATRTMTVPDANFTAARTDAAQSFTGDQTLSTGNLVIGTDGKGIDFSITPGTGTSELFDDYEEGNWTPVLSDGTNNATASVFGRYTKVGRNVTVFANIFGSALGSVTGAVRVTGLPFTTANSGNSADFSAISVGTTGGLNITAGQSVIGSFAFNNTFIRLFLTDSAAGVTSLQASEFSDDGYIIFSGTYMVD